MQLVFDVLAKDNASSTFRNVGDSANKAGKQAESGLGKVTNAAKMLGGALIGAGIISGFKSLYDAADESRKIAARTEGVIKSMGGAAGVSAKQVGDLAGAISKKTGVDDEAIQSGQNLLLTFGNLKDVAGEGNDIFSQTSALMVDMSAAMGTDASGSAIQLGKAMNDPIKGITALTRVGVSFTEQQKDQIRTLVETGDTMGAQKIILGELERQFGGAAESMATPMDKVKVSVGNAAEQIGGYLVPAVDAAATWFSEEFLPAAEGVGGFLTDDLGPALRGTADTVGFLVDVGQDLVGFVSDLPGPVQAGVAALGAFVVLKGPVSSFFDTVALKALYARDAIGTAKAGGLRGAAGGLVGLLGGPWGIALGAATVGLGFLVSALGDSDDAAADSAAAQGELAAALEQTKGAIDETVRAAAAEDLVSSGVDDWADDLGISVTVMTDALTGVPGALEQVQGAFRRAISGEYTEIIDANGQVTGAYSEQGEAMLGAREKFDALAGVLPGVAQKQRDVAAATESTGTAAGIAVPLVNDFQTGLEDASEAANDAQRETNMLKTALDVLTGASVSMIEVEAAYQDSLANASGALKDLNGTVLDGAGQLNLQSEAGRAAGDVLLGVRDSGNQLIATMVQQGRSSDEVRAKDAELRESFIRSAEQMGIGRQAAENLANQILGIPAERETKILADTIAAETAVRNLQIQIDNLRGRTVDIVARAIMPDLNGSVSGSGRMGTFATGGYTGDGGKYEPKGVVHGGEFVFTKEETAKAGPSALARLAKSLRGYAGGGQVGGLPVSIAAELNASSYNKQMNGLAQQVIDKYEPVQGFIGALQWARSQVGRPYVWGGVGPGGYDCSGFMSAITNVIRGRNPHSRVGSTASFPWAGFGGGAGGMFAIGSTPNAGGGIGHMAGTLLGVNVESTGGVGVKVGGSARGVNSGLFSTRASLYDNGGILPPGLTVAYNGTGKPETIRTAEQEAALQGGPIDLSMRSIELLAAAMVRGAGAAVIAHGDRAALNQRSFA